ncbi:MAG: TolC family protein [Verrucomicrobiales bacterium]
MAEERERAQNTREFFATDEISIFEQENIFFNSGLQGKIPFGTVYEVAVNSNRLDNSLTRRETARFSPEYESDLTLTLTQPLLRDFGSDVNMTQVRIAESNLRMSQHDLRSKVNEIAVQVMTAYYETIFAQENIRVKRDAIDVANALLEENQRRLDLGVMKPIDVIQAEASVSEAEEALIAAESFLVARQNTLKSLIFADFEAVALLRIEAADQLSWSAPEVGDGATLLAEALASNPQMLRQREQISQEDVRLKYAKNQVKPRVDLQASIGYNGLDGDWGGSFRDYGERRGPEWTAGIIFSYPLGNRAAKAQLAESELRREQATYNAAFMKNSIAAALATAVDKVKANQRRLATTGKSVELAQKGAEAEQKRLENGLTTTYNVSQMQRELSNARTRQLGAVVELNQAVSEMYQIVGRIPQLEEHINLVFPDDQTIPADPGAIDRLMEMPAK